MNQNLNLKQQLRCIYTSDFFSGLRITDAVWVALLAARGFSLWEIGLAESVYHIVSLFCEVPSGMAADLLGRRKTLLSGGVLTVTCNLLMAFAPNLFTICLAMGLNALAMTMFSGTFTALVYDSLKTEGREDEYIQVSANSSQISMLANAIGSLASLLKRFLGFAGFYLLSAAFEGVSTAALALMEEPIVTKAQASRGRQTLRALPGQFTKVKLLLDVRENAVVVPSKAIVIEKGGAYIFVVRPDSVVEKRFIETGPELDNKTVVERGLLSGERIVVEGYHKLNHGMRVEAVEPRRDNGVASN